MSRNIPEHSISIGYNPNHGQKFFDLISLYDKYIKEFYFGIDHHINGFKMNSEKELRSFDSIDTYGYPANLLINNIGESNGIWEKIEACKRVVNLKAITLIEPELGPEIKKRYPDLTIHVSVRFWDKNKFIHPEHRLDWLKQRCVDVVNVSGSYHYNNHMLMEEIRKCGMQVKFITNEGCIINRSYNYTELPGCEKFECNPNVCSDWICNCDCAKVLSIHPWMILANINIYKESLDFYDIDILKISGRHRELESLNTALEYWVYGDKTEHLLTWEKSVPINSEDKYKTFYDFVKFKSTTCKGHCASCGRCKDVYKKLMLN